MGSESIKTYKYRFTIDDPKKVQWIDGKVLVIKNGERKLLPESTDFKFASIEQLTRNQAIYVMHGTLGYKISSGDFKDESVNYYTPELSEFHHGFEYEIQHTDPPFEWQSNIFIIDDYDWAAMSDENMSLFRVKYLDKQDIEECGFEFVEIDEDFTVFTKDKDKYSHYEISLKEDSRTLYIDYRYQANLTARVEDEKNRSPNCIFHGVIKNINELKKLLKQLGI